MMGKDMKQFIWLVIVIGFITLLCILYCLTFVCGEEQPDIDTVIVPTECEGVFIEVEYADAPNNYANVTPAFRDEVGTYLSWTGASYDHLVDSGRRLDMLKRGIPAIVHPHTQAYADAAFIRYYKLCFETFMAYYAPGTPVLAQSMEIARACYEAGIDWEMAAATLYAESNWGRQTTGLVWGNAYDVHGWVKWCLREMSNPNDVDCFVNEFHMPANRETYRFNFGNVVERARAWRP